MILSPSSPNCEYINFHFSFHITKRLFARLAFLRKIFVTSQVDQMDYGEAQNSFQFAGLFIHFPGILMYRENQVRNRIGERAKNDTRSKLKSPVVIYNPLGGKQHPTVFHYNTPKFKSERKILLSTGCVAKHL